MRNTPEELDKRLKIVEEFMQSLTTKQGIPLNVENSFRDRIVDSMIIGYGTLSGGKLDITDSRIVSTSVGIALRLNSSSGFAGRSDLAGGYLSGNTYRFFEASFTETYQIAYLIKP